MKKKLYEFASVHSFFRWTSLELLPQGNALITVLLDDPLTGCARIYNGIIIKTIYGSLILKTCEGVIITVTAPDEILSQKNVWIYPNLVFRAHYCEIRPYKGAGNDSYH